MKLEKIRAHRKNSHWLEGLFRNNALLVSGLALPFAVMVSTSLKNSIAISFVLFIALVPTVVFASLVGKYMTRWISIMVYSLFSMAMILLCIPLLQMISTEIVPVLGIYIPIMSVNSLMFMLCRRYDKPPYGRTFQALADSIVYCLGFTVAIAVIGFLRELLSNHTIWGIAVPLHVKLSGLQMAFAGFIILALLGALAKVIRRFYICLCLRDEQTDEEELI